MALARVRTEPRRTDYEAAAHIGSWLAEAGVVLEQIRMGTYQPEEIDIDSMIETFFETMKDVPFWIVRAQASAVRSRMLQAWVG